MTTRFTATDLADRIGHSADYWLRAARAGRVPYRRLGRVIWWEPEDVAQIVAAAYVEPADALRSHTSRSRAASRRTA